MNDPGSVRARLGTLASPRRLAFAVIAPPLAWAAQGLLGWYFAARACRTGGPGWGPLSSGGVRLLLLTVSVAAFAVTVAALAAARRDMRRLAQKTPGTPLGESAGYLATVGVLIGTALAIGIFWAGLPALLVDVCGEMR